MYYLTIPRKDADFNVRQELITSTAVARGEEWELDMPFINTLVLPRKVIWVAAWAGYQDIRNRSRNIVLHKNESRANYEVPLRGLVKMIDGCQKVTHEEKIAMGFATGETRRVSAFHVPTTYPVCKFDASKLRHVIVHFKDLDKTNRAKPQGVHGAEFCWAILDGRPESLDLLSSHGFDTATPFTIGFEENQRGKVLWICARWVTNSGEKGMWGEIDHVVIP